MKNIPYGHVKHLSDKTVEDARARVVEALANEGFGVLTEINVTATLKKKIDVDFRPYLILGACNPKLAHAAMEAEPQLGLLLPCNVVLQQTGEGVEFSIVDPRAMFQVVENDTMAAVADEVNDRLVRVMDAVPE